MAISTSKLAATTSEIQEPDGKGSGGMFVIDLFYSIQSKQKDKIIILFTGKKKYEYHLKTEKIKAALITIRAASPLLEYYKFWFNNYIDKYLISIGCISVRQDSIF